jgi:hypothetical protein
MSNTLHVVQSALDDIQNALDWLKFIQTHPEATSFLDKRFRGVQLKKFPFTIYYNYDEVNSVIRIAAFLHNKRDKSILKKRV